jgi:arylformamidase
MRVHDITVAIRAGMPIYDRNPGVSLTRARAIAESDHVNISRLDLGVHTGTHVDAPLHFLEGAPGAEAIPLEPLLGPAAVVDATGVERVLDAEAVAELDIPAEAERVLFKTRNSNLWNLPRFTRDFVRLDGGGARRLTARGVRLVGLDYLSIGDADAHLALFEAGVVPLEGLDLRGIAAGTYRLVCLPLRLVGSDGAPARVLLIEES